MRWTERQRAMLREMGVRLWLAEDDAVPVAAEPEARVEAKRAPAAQRVASETAPPTPRVASEATREPQRLPGLAPADWLVVSEPLDAADPQQQLLLENMLRAIGIGLLAPGRERRAVFFALAAAGADGVRGAADLRSALDAVAPRCVLAFGRAAAAALLGADAPVGSLRGRVHADAGAPVVVTFSLAFLLRHPAEKAKAWADLCLAVRAIATPTS